MTIALSFAQAQELSGLSKTTLHKLVAEGRLKKLTINRRSFITRSSLQALFGGETF
jgi:hypothetical protein